NFGINEQPVAKDEEALLQLNPGKDTQVTVPTLEISDKEDGIPKVINITTLPSNGILYYDGVAVVLNLSISDANLSKFSVDPKNGDVNVTFMYTSIDVTGWASEPATVVMPFDGLTIQGQVFVDGNGDSSIDGESLADGFSLPLFVTLFDANDMVVASIPLDSNGSYEFNASMGIVPNSNYTIVLSSEMNSRVAILPNNWMHTNNGTFIVPVTTRNVNEVNFGLNQQPTVSNVIAMRVVNPGTNIRVGVPDLNISRNEDGSTSPRTVTLTDLPANGTLYYDGTPVVEGEVLNDFNSTLLTLDPDDGNVSISFNYTSTDEAGFESETAMVTIPFFDPDTDGDGITNANDLDDDNDGILDTLENNTSLNGGDTDKDGIPDRLDLDSDGDGILDLEESNFDFTTLDGNGDGVIDSTKDINNDGLMDIVGTVILIDTDKDDIPDFQDVDSDNDGLSDLVEGGMDANLDANSDGILDNQTDSDADGIADMIDSDNGGTRVAMLDTDKDGINNYRDSDSDGDSLLDVVEVGGDDANNDGYIEPVGTLVDGRDLPDENANGIPDVLEIKLRDDNRTATPGERVTMNLLENDSGDVDKGSIKLRIPTDFNGTARLSADGKRMVVDGEGEWFVDDAGILTFTPEAGFRGSPRSIMYSASNKDGSKSAVANVSITVTDVAGATTEECETYSEDSVSLLGGLGLFLMLLFSSIFGVYLIRNKD
ncbi:MAG: Unknown protein, partial [uncultured Sulfurovum sp.]